MAHTVAVYYVANAATSKMSNIFVESVSPFEKCIVFFFTSSTFEVMSPNIYMHFICVLCAVYEIPRHSGTGICHKIYGLKLMKTYRTNEII